MRSYGGWVMMGIFWTSYALCQVLMSGIGLMLPSIRSEMNLSSAQAGALGAIGWILAAFATVPLSAWITRYPPKRTVSIALGALVLIHWVNAWSPNYIVLLAARGAGLLLILSIPSVMVLLQRQWFAPAQMGTVKGIETGMASLGSMAALAGIPILLAALDGWRETYAITGFALLPVLVCWILLAGEKQAPGGSGTGATTQHEKALSILSILKRRDFLLLGIGSAGASIAYVAIMVFWPMYAIEAQGITLETAGLILSCAAFGGMAGSMLAGIQSDRIGLRRPIPLAAGLLLPAGYFAFLIFDSIPILAVVAFLTGMCSCLYIPAILAMVFELKGIGPRETAVGIGFITAITNLGAAFGSQFAGILIDRFGAFPALAMISLSPLILSICVLFCSETGKKAFSGESLIAGTAAKPQT